MPLHLPEPPAQAAAILQSTFGALAKNRNFRTPALRNAKGPLELGRPHQIFTLGLTDLVAGRGLAAAKPAGWSSLVSAGTKVLASAETALLGPSQEHVFSAFNEGRFVDSIADAIQTVQTLPEVQAGQFELRVLRVPALYVKALWLHGATDGGDLLVPLAPSPVDAPAGKPIAAAVLLQELAAKAQTAAAVGPGDRSGG